MRQSNERGTSTRRGFHDLDISMFQTSRRAQDRRTYDRDMPHGRVYSWTESSRDNSNGHGSHSRACSAPTPTVKSKPFSPRSHSSPIVKRCYCFRGRTTLPMRLWSSISFFAFVHALLIPFFVPTTDRFPCYDISELHKTAGQPAILLSPAQRPHVFAPLPNREVCVKRMEELAAH